MIQLHSVNRQAKTGLGAMVPWSNLESKLVVQKFTHDQWIGLIPMGSIWLMNVLIILIWYYICTVYMYQWIGLLGKIETG